MSRPLPEPMDPRESRAEVLLEYLAYFRSVLEDKLDGLPDADLRGSRLPSGWSPLALLKHLTFVERRWLEWGFEGRDVSEPWGDSVDGRWTVTDEETRTELVAALARQAEVSQAVVRAHRLSDVGQPGERWDGQPPATLERILLHLLQEYARHVGHLDVVRELIDGATGE